jgi:phosphoglycolate phosphatase-like HAD superfamily hydrolase
MPAVLLDLDRTLVDLQSFTDYAAAWAEVRSLVDLSLVGSGPATGWPSATRACMEVVAALPDGALWHTVSGVIERHERAAIQQSVAMPGASEFLAALGHRPHAVVTLLTAGVAHEALAAHGLRVDVIVGRGPTIRPKPSADGLRAALARLGAPTSGAVMVGDSTWDALAALEADIGFVGVHAGPDEFTALVPVVPVCASLAEALRELPPASSPPARPSMST